MGSTVENQGSFYFNSENILSVNQTPINDLVKNFLNEDISQFQSNEVILDEGNKLVAGKSHLTTPLYVYSKEKLVNNFKDYKKSFEQEITDNEIHISYSIKANFNPSILKIFHQHGSWASLVNKNELLLALKVGIKGENLIFNGNGKKIIEIELAIKNKCYLNVDSLFNLIHTIKVAKQLQLQKNENLKSCFPVKLLIRINQNENANVHQYLNTSGDACKFGTREEQLDELINHIKSNDCVQISGFHSHLGSTIKNLDLFDQCVNNLVQIVNAKIKEHEINTIEIINFGGGLGINYERFASRTSKNFKQEQESQFPKPNDLAKVIASHVKKLNNSKIKILVEPGRSLVGDSCILLTKFLGFKKNGNKNFLVVDSSMCECIRPCLYSAYHHIEFIEPLSFDKEIVDVVGPVCESGDFLGKERLLPIPNNNSDDKPLYLAVMDVGAYCSSMALNYNMHTKPAEVFIEEVQDDNSKQTRNEYFLSRKPERLDDILSCFTDF